MRIVRRLLLAVCVLGLVPAAACEKSPQTATPAAPAAGPALWKTGDADTTIYLFGTVHVLPPTLQWRTEKVETALKDSSAVYFETDIYPDPAKLTAVVSELGTYPASEKLSDHLSADERADLIKASEELGVPMILLENKRPWLAAMMLSDQVIIKAGYDPETGVERTLSPIAVQGGKQIRKFETIEEQLLSFADLPEKVQVDYLMDGVRQVKEEMKMLDDLVAAWARGDVPTLEKIMIEGDLDDLPEVYDALLVERNRAWAEKLDALAKGETGTFFVAVGAGHLAGNDSVIKMMTDKGYTVARVE